jgi:hypothetical protein
MRYKLSYTLKYHKQTYTSVPRATIPSDEIRELQNLHGNKLKTMTVLRDSEGADHPDNAGKFFLYQIVK